METRNWSANVQARCVQVIGKIVRQICMMRQEQTWQLPETFEAASNVLKFLISKMIQLSCLTSSEVNELRWVDDWVACHRFKCLVAKILVFPLDRFALYEVIYTTVLTNVLSLDMTLIYAKDMPYVLERVYKTWAYCNECGWNYSTLKLRFLRVHCPLVVIIHWPNGCYLRPKYNTLPPQTYQYDTLILLCLHTALTNNGGIFIPIIVFFE